jgi:hypothetical protein
MCVPTAHWHACTQLVNARANESNAQTHAYAQTPATYIGHTKYSKAKNSRTEQNQQKTS